MMTDDSGGEVGVISWLSDLRTVVGGVITMALGLLVFIGWGKNVLKAPAKADSALSLADSAVVLSHEAQEDIQDTKRTLRIVFCTSESFDLSETARAQLQCWRLEERR